MLSTFHYASKFSKFFALTLGCACLASLVGCTTPEKMKSMPAPEAWTTLQDEQKQREVAGRVAQVFVNVDWNKLREDAAKNAEDASNKAMQSGLPAEAVRAMVDDVSQFLVVELPKIPEVVKSDQQYVLAFGDFTSIPPGAEIKMAKDELMSKLFENADVKKSYYVVTTTEAESEKMIKTVAGGDLSTFRDPLQRGPDRTAPVKFDPAYIYLINGTLLDTKDAPNHSITISMKMDLIKPVDRQLVKTQFFKKTYVWHPTRNAWELQP